MPNRNLLLFAYHFPPDPSAGSTRAHHFAKYLGRMGYRVAVFTAASERFSGPFETYCIADPWLHERRAGSGWQCERAVRKLLWPGATGLRWGLRAAQVALRHYRESSDRGGGIILSTFPPIGVHLAAWRLARQTGLPWIADFRDPMTFAPGVWRQLNPIHRRAACRLEHWVVRRAGAIVANTDALAEQIRTRHRCAAAKVHTIWNGFDPEERIGPLPLPERPYRLYSHVGELYAGRSPTGLLHSIGRLVDNGRLDSKRIRILLAGPAEPETLPGAAFLNRATQQGWLEWRPGFVPKSEALRIAQTSDGLLLIQPHSAIQVPAKLFEYLQIGRPVLAYVPEGSQTEAVLINSGVPHVCAYAGLGPDKLDQAVLQYFSLPAESVNLNAFFENEFSADRRARKLAEVIEAIQPGL